MSSHAVSSSATTARISRWGQLPMEVSLHTAAELRSQWLGELEYRVGDAEAVELDGSAVEHFDAAGAQSLLALAHALGARGHRRHRVRPPDGRVHARRARGRAAQVVTTAREPD